MHAQGIKVVIVCKGSVQLYACKKPDDNDKVVGEGRLRGVGGIRHIHLQFTFTAHFKSKPSPKYIKMGDNELLQRIAELAGKFFSRV